MTINTLIIFGALIISSSCTGQGQKSATKETETTSSWLVGDTVNQVNGEIRGIIQDSKNNLWFASNGNGVYKYDGQSIINFTEKNGYFDMMEKTLLIFQEKKTYPTLISKNIRLGNRD